MASGSENEIAAQFRGRLGAFALDAAFSVPARGVTALFGPSGCGKTTVLRCVAGLRRLDGSLSVAGESWQDARTFRPPHRRGVGYVFQEPSLFPHLTVRGNLDYGRRRALRGGAPERVAFAEVVELLGLGRLVDRDPAMLSGGERQRVAIGRALLSQPRLLLMDEPMAALDRTAKDEILPFLERLHSTLLVPVLLVTHDATEVERLADRVVVMREGRVVATAPTGEAMVRADLPFARHPEAAAVLAARVLGSLLEDGLLQLDIDGQTVLAVRRPLAANRPVRLRIAAGDVSLALERPMKSTILNVLDTVIESIEPLGSAEAIVVLRLHPGEQRLLARITARSARVLGLASGRRVFAQVKGVSLSTAEEGSS